MRILHKIDQYFWACLIGAIGLGFAVPTFFHQFESSILYIIMAILFLLFMKVDVADIMTHIRRPFLMLYIVAVNMIGIPLVTHFLFKPLDPEYAMGLLLLSALPAGVSSAAFTDIMEGHTSLTLTIIILTTLVAPFTIPFLFFMVYNTGLDVDYTGLFYNLVQVIVIPMAISQLVKVVVNDEFTQKVEGYVNALVIFLLSFMIMVVIAGRADYIMAHTTEMVYLLGTLYGAFLIFQLLAYFSVYKLNKGEKVAVSNSKVIMNNILGIVLAIAFFGPKVELLVILSIIPWNTMIIIFHWYKKYLP